MNITPRSSFQCKPCNMNFANTNELMKHLSNSSSDVDICWEAFYDEEMRKNREAKKILCEQCFKIQTRSEICQNCRNKDLIRKGNICGKEPFEKLSAVKQVLTDEQVKQNEEHKDNA